MATSNPDRHWLHWLRRCCWALLLPWPLAAVAALTQPPAVDAAWRDQFVFGSDADSLRHHTTAWARARAALQAAREQGDLRAELRAAAFYFLTIPTHTAENCRTFQHYLALAQAGGAAYERELFDLGVASAWNWSGRPCAGQISPQALEVLARRLGDPARMFYVLEAQAADAMASSRFGEITSIRSRQLDVAIAPFQRAKAFIELGMADLVADLQSTQASRWLERARQEFDPEEFQVLAVDLEAGLAAVEFRRHRPATAMTHVYRVREQLRNGMAAPETAASYLSSFAKYLNRLQRTSEALDFLAESRRFQVDDLSTRVHVAAAFLTIYAELRTPEARAKGEQEVRRIDEWMADLVEFPIARVKAARAIADFHERFGRLDAALQARKQLEAAMEDAQRSADDATRVTLQEKLNVALKDQEYAGLKARNELQEAQQRGWIGAFAAAAGGVAGTGVALAVAVRRGRRLARVSAELAQRNGELEARSSSRIRLLAAACHDLRQPAHALGMLAELGRAAQQEPARFSAWLHSVRRITASLGDMLDELMDLGRLDGGHYTPLLGDVSLAELMQEVMLHFGPLARRKGLALAVLPVALHTHSDRHLLRRILFNVVSNAIKYTDAGEVRVSAEAMGNGVRLTVQDSGPGIPQDKIDDVFRDHVRLNPRMAAEGLGVGLAIVRRAADLLGHALTLRSAPGQGTCVTLTLPLASLTAATAPILAPAAADDLTAAAGGVVAIMENDPDVSDAMAALLQAWGYTVLAGADAQAILALARRSHERPDLVISDLHLDNTDGLTEVTRLRQGLDAPALAALLVTGDLDGDITGQAARAGVHLAHKPLAPNKLSALVRQLLNAPPQPAGPAAM
ncbi:MAG: response regulator [Pelomonas sp.]|nr:response regulator [Roseateles sp.]